MASHVREAHGERVEKVNGTSSPIYNGDVTSLSRISMNPNDIGALLAEVIDDYRRLGSELTMLHPPSLSGLQTHR